MLDFHRLPTRTISVPWIFRSWIRDVVTQKHPSLYNHQFQSLKHFGCGSFPFTDLIDIDVYKTNGKEFFSAVFVVT